MDAHLERVQNPVFLWKKLPHRNKLRGFHRCQNLPATTITSAVWIRRVGDITPFLVICLHYSKSHSQGLLSVKFIEARDPTQMTLGAAGWSALAAARVLIHVLLALNCWRRVFFCITLTTTFRKATYFLWLKQRRNSKNHLFLSKITVSFCPPKLRFPVCFLSLFQDIDMFWTLF